MNKTVHLGCNNMVPSVEWPFAQVLLWVFQRMIFLSRCNLAQTVNVTNGQEKVFFFLIFF